MLILGIVMKHDDKMTGEYVYNVYALLYFKGVNFTDIVEAMYLVFIIVGTLSVILSLIMLSDIFKTLQYKWKNKGVSIVMIVIQGLIFYHISELSKYYAHSFLFFSISDAF